MDTRDYLEAIRRESAALAEAASACALDAPVASCPGWDVAALVTHIGQVQQWATMYAQTRSVERLSRDRLPAPPPRDEVLPWFRQVTGTLLAVLQATDPATPVWSFTIERTAAFWIRRQAQEVAVHRWDAQLAAGRPEPIAPLLAADGVDEALTVLPTRTPERFVGAGETLHFHCTDTAGEWLVRLAPGGLEVKREHAKAVAAARGGASELDLFLWGRLDAGSLEVFGDAALLARFQGLTAT